MSLYIPKALLPLVRYKCGCIGFAPNEQMHAVIIDCCDKDLNDQDGYFLGDRQMTDGSGDDLRQKPFEPLSEKEIIRIQLKMSQQLLAGGKWQDLKALLGL